MNATEQEKLNQIALLIDSQRVSPEFYNGFVWLISQLRAAQDEITGLKSDDALATAYACGMKAGQNQWQPIATAPKDKRVLLYSPTKGIVRGYWWSGNLDWPEGGWVAEFTIPDLILREGKSRATHWQPLPQPPKI